MPTTGYAAAIDTGDLIMSYGPEATWATKPAVAFQEIRLDGEGFSSTKSRTRPNEINPDGQASAAITTKEESTGSLNFSVSAGTHNDLIASSIGAHSSLITGITFAATADSFTDSANGFLTNRLAVGMYIKVGGFTTAGNNGIFSITAVTAGEIHVSPAPAGVEAAGDTVTIGTGFHCNVDMSAATIAATASGFTDSGAGFITGGIQVGQMIKVAGFTTTGLLANATYRVDTLAAGEITTTPVPGAAKVAGDTVTIKGAMIRNSVEFQSFYFQKEMASNLFLQYPGAWPTGGSLDVGVGDYLKGTLSFLNKSEVTATTNGSTGATLDAPTGTVVDSVNGIGSIYRNGTAISATIQKVGVKWNKEGARAQYGIGSAAALGMGKGKLLVNGSLSSYFKDFSLYTEFKNETGGPIWFPALDSAGKGYVTTFTNATIMNPKIVFGGPNQDVMADFEVEGNPGSTVLYGGKTIQIDYFG